MTRLMFIAFIIAGLLSSCMVTEDFYFAKDGSVKYQLTYDMSQMTQMGSDLDNAKALELSKEPMSISKVLMDSIGDDYDKLPEEYKQLIKDVEVFYFQPSVDENGKETTLNIWGDFSNTDQLNAGLAALNKIYKLESFIKKGEGELKEQGENSLDELMITGASCSFSWNGELLTRTYLQQEELTGKEEVVIDNNDNNSLMGMMANSLKNTVDQMLGMGSYTARYHFPSEILSVDIEEAEIADDKKSVSIPLQGLKFLDSDFKQLNVRTK